MKVINFFGGPGCGKSTTAAGLFYDLKVKGYCVELVTEYAKDMVYEKRHNILEDQLYILAKQARRISRLKDSVDFVVTDSPILLSMIYNTDTDIINDLAIEIFNRYDNTNLFITREKAYQPYGRMQTLTQAKEIDQKILQCLLTLGFPFDIIDSTTDLVTKIEKELT
jgi:hypothetical protein